jgi:esterase/lipase
MNMGGTPEEAQQREQLYTLDPYIADVRAPFFAVNGSEDKVNPASQTVKMFERAVNSSYRKLKIYEGLPHCAYYGNRAILLDVADWILEVMPS